MVKLALYKGKGSIFNGFIRWWSRSQYSHCELVIGTKWYSSSVMDGGVRVKEIEAAPENWDFIELPWADPVAIQLYFEMTDYQRYGWVSLLFGQLFNRAIKVRHSQFCSEWCAAALTVPSSSAYSPAMLGKLCEWLMDE